MLLRCKVAVSTDFESVLVGVLVMRALLFGAF